MRRADEIRLRHMLDAAHEAMSFTRGRARDDLETDRQLVLSLVKERDLSNRQAKALSRIVEHGSLTIRNFERLCPNVNRRLLQRDMRAMIEQGIVEIEATSPTDPGKRYVFNEG